MTVTHRTHTRLCSTSSYNSESQLENVIGGINPVKEEESPTDPVILSAEELKMTQTSGGQLKEVGGVTGFEGHKLKKD